MFIIIIDKRRTRRWHLEFREFVVGTRTHSSRKTYVCMFWDFICFDCGLLIIELLLTCMLTYEYMYTCTLHVHMLHIHM